MDDGASFRDSVRRGYDDLGPVYHEQRSPSDHERERVEAFLDDLPDDARLLDVGCGRGRPVLRRAERLEAVGLDVSRGQLTAAADVAPSAALVQGDAVQLPFASDAFDAVTALHSVIHVPLESHSAVASELARVLRPGGELLLAEGTSAWSGTIEDWLGDGTAMSWDIAGEDATVGHLQDAGFEVRDRWKLRDELADEESYFLLLRAYLPAERH